MALHEEMWNHSFGLYGTDTLHHSRLLLGKHILREQVHFSGRNYQLERPILFLLIFGTLKSFLVQIMNS